MICFPIPADEPVCVNCNDEGCEYCCPADGEDEITLDPDVADELYAEYPF